MDIFQISEEFSCVNKVLLSSKSYEHMKCCDNLFNNFINKWRFDITEDLKITLFNDFRINYKEQSEKIKKNTPIM